MHPLDTGRAWFPKSPITQRDALVAVGLALTDPLLDPAVLREAMRVLADYHKHDELAWSAMWACFVRGLGLLHQQAGSPLMEVGVVVGSSTLGVTPDGAPNGAYWESDGAAFGSPGDWGAPDGVDDATPEWCVPDVWTAPLVSAVAIAACHGQREAVFALDRAKYPGTPLHAARLLAWSARQLGVLGPTTVADVALLVAGAQWDTVDEAEAALLALVAPTVAVSQLGGKKV